MTEPRTEAGRLMLAETSPSALSKMKAWHYTLDGMAARIAAIEAEATAAAEQRLRDALLLLHHKHTGKGGSGLCDECLHTWPCETFRILSGGSPATPGPTGATANETPPDGLPTPAASPRQGEPVAVNIRRKPIPASVVRLMRIEQRPAGRGTIIVHEIDEVHPNTEACDICQLVTGAALSEPAES